MTDAPLAKGKGHETHAVHVRAGNHRRQQLGVRRAHSDYTKSFPLQTLKTFEFKNQHRISRDPLANNDIWANDVREAIRNDLRSHGVTEATSGQPASMSLSTSASRTATTSTGSTMACRCFIADSGEAGGVGRAGMTYGPCRIQNPRSSSTPSTHTRTNWSGVATTPTR
jgi:hypothetical protein